MNHPESPWRPAPLPEPDAMWHRIEAALAAQAPPARRPPRAWLLAAAALLAIVGGTAAGVVARYRAPAAWRVSTGADLRAGDWVTASTGPVDVAVGRIGTVTIDAGARVRREAAGLFGHRLRLEHGRIDAVINAPPRLFTVVTPVAIATDLGCAYTLEVDSASGSSLLHVTLGWVELAGAASGAVVPAGMMAAVAGDGSPGTPYPATLEDEARRALARLDAGTGTDLDLETVIAALATPDDYLTVRRPGAVTLWHLVPRVRGAARDRVLARLAQLIPPPAGVRMEDARALDRLSLERWRRVLSPMWSDEAQGWLGTISRRVWDWIVG